MPSTGPELLPEVDTTVVLLAIDAADSARCAAVCARLGLRVVTAATESAFVKQLLEPRARQVGLVVPGRGLDVAPLVALVRGIYRLRAVPLVVVGVPARIIGSPEPPEAHVEEATTRLLGANWSPANVVVP